VGVPMNDEMPDCPVNNLCACYRESANMPCCCGHTEKALRFWSAGSIFADHMTGEQREWCLNEINRVEGYNRKDYEDSPDTDLARGVLLSWQDYCRDKGLL
jgi:hypothetical protein